MKKIFFLFIFLEFFAVRSLQAEELNPAAVGWGNLLVPGLGATLRGLPGKGLAEAGLELGAYFGGTFGVREGGFTIDGAVKIPTTRKLTRPLMGQALQEFGLKYHFYNTFYHYQQATLDVNNLAYEKNYQQPIYRGSWKDMLAAPFSWQTLSSPWVYPLIIASGAYLAYSYKTTSIQHLGFRINSKNEAMYGTTQVSVIPVTGAIGEEPLFRGFIMREMQQYTGSVLASELIQASLFTLIHPANLRASGFLSGIYFGMMTNHFEGNLEPAIAAHFWVNVFDGIISYVTLRRAQGKNTPFAPPLSANATIAF